MYRSRMSGGDLSKVTLEYVSSVSEDVEIAWYDIVGSQAHVIMLYNNKIISKQVLKKILKALEDLKKQKFDGVYDAEDIHELIEMLVIKKAGVASGGRMHTARSRNDQVALDIRMKVRDDINVICSCLLDLIEMLMTVAQKHHKTVMPLYTHLQQAQAGTLSHYLLAHADALFRDFDRFYTSYERVNQSPLGAGPIGGTSIPINRNSTARMLGFDGVVENSIDATSTRDFVAEYIGNVAIMMTNLSKLAEDFVIWSTTEFSFIEISDEFASPSSVMPQKKNPDVLELTRGKTADVIGNLMGVLGTVKGLATGYGRDLQQTKLSIWSTSKTGVAALIVIKSMLGTMKVNKYKMRQAAEKGYLVALDIAEKLVLQGMPFRTAHKISGSLVQRAHLSKKASLSKLDMKDVRVCAKGNGVDAKILAKIIRESTVKSSLEDRVSLGSSGFLEQKRMIKQRFKLVMACRADIVKRHDKTSLAMSRLEDMVCRLVR